MASIVPYSALNPTAKAAQSFVSFVGNNPELAREAGEQTKKAFKSFARSAASRLRNRRKYGKPANRIGKPPTYRGSPKTFTAVDSDPTALATRTFYEQNLTGIPKDTGANDIDQRQRDLCYVQGFKIITSIQNTGTKPIHFNMAVLMNRTAPGSSPSANEFFRGSGDTRGLDFSSVLLNSNDFRSRPINSDKNVVLMHKRVTISPPNNTSYEAGWKSSFHTLDCWIPLKRVLTFDNGVCNNGVYLVYWCDEFNTAAGTLAQASKLTHSQRVITYFKEPKVNY